MDSDTTTLEDNGVNLTIRELVVSLTISFLVVAGFLVAVIANSLVLVLMIKKRKLHLVANRFVANLAAISLLSTITLSPLLLADLWISESVALDQPSPQAPSPMLTLSILCQSLDAIGMFCVSASIVASVLIAGDRYCAVADALRYHALVTRARSLVAISANWLCGLVLAVLTAALPTTAKPWATCAAPIDDGVHHLTLAAMAALALFLLPLVVMVWMYVRIYLYAHRSSKKQRRNTQTASIGCFTLAQHSLSRNMDSPSKSIGTTPVRLSPPAVAPIVSNQYLHRSASCLLMNNIRRKLSNASMFMYREEGRTARVSMLVIGMFFINWTPYFVMKALSTVYETPAMFTHTAAMLAASNAAISPFVYSFRSKRGRRELRQLLGLKKVPIRRSATYTAPLLCSLPSLHYQSTVTSLYQLRVSQLQRQKRLSISEPTLFTSDMQPRHKQRPCKPSKTIPSPEVVASLRTSICSTSSDNSHTSKETTASDL